MNRYALLFVLVFGLVACGSEEAAETGSNVVEACTDLVASDVCPAGTTLSFDAQAVADCGGSVGASVDLTSQSGEISGRCGSSGECSFVCVPPDPCCGGEEWTETSYKCETPCAAVCSCDGKCGKVTGAECEADCGTCSGGQVCSADNVCVDECPEGAEVCGDECFFPVDGDVCFNGEVCEAEKNCEGKACGSNGCGGKCGECQGSESCDNGQCVSDCKGSLPVCQGDIVQACKAVEGAPADAAWAWQDSDNCSPLADTPYCAELSSGATCVECTTDDHCGVGKGCDTEKGVCIDTCVPDCTNEGVCMNGSEKMTDDDGNELVCKDDSECGQGTCEGSSKRYCGADGCGDFCEGVDYSCNGNGNWCNPENGKCDTPLEECSFSFQQMVNDEPSDTWTKVVIPYGNPFCNSVVPELGIILDDDLPAEAVVSGQVLVDPDAPFENVCTWSIHEFDGGNKLKCGEQLCSMIAIPMDQNPIEYIKKTKLNEEDFCCKESSTCEDFGVLEDQPFCNTPDHPAFQTTKSDTWCAGETPEPIEEGILLRCAQKGKVTEFKCENCETNQDGSWKSKCSQEGWGCFETVSDGEEGGCGPDGCGPSWPEGTVLGFCQESQADFCDTDFSSSCFYTEDGAPTAYSTCSYDSVSNEISESEGAQLCDAGLVCVDAVWTDEDKPPCDDCSNDSNQGAWWKKSVSATCEEPVTCPTNGASYDQFCNDPSSPGYDEKYPESTIMECVVEGGVNSVQIHPSGSNGGDEWKSCAEQQADGICVMDNDGNPSCQASQAGECESTVPTCKEGGIETCAYDGSTNSCVCQTSPCPDGEVCNNHMQSPAGEGFFYELLDSATCQEKQECPSDLPTSTGRVCNSADAPWHQTELSAEAVIQCSSPDWNNGVGVNYVEWTVHDYCQGQEKCYPYEGFAEATCKPEPTCEKDSWCSADLDHSWKCLLNQNTGESDEFSIACDLGEQCYWSDEQQQLSQADGDSAAPAKTTCVDMSCGPSSADGNYQTACFDLDDSCWLASPDSNPQGDAFWDAAFGQFVIDPICPQGDCTNGFEVSHACIPNSGCPTGEGTIKIQFTETEGTEENPSAVTWIQNKAPDGSYYFGGNEPNSSPGFIFACLETSSGPFYPVFEGMPESLHAPKVDGEASGKWGVLTSHCAGSTANDIACCICASVEEPVPANSPDAPWFKATSAADDAAMHTYCINQCDHP